RFRADLEALSADVRKHRHRDRQRPRESLRALGAVDGPSVPPLVRGRTDAESGSAKLSRPVLVARYSLLVAPYSLLVTVQNKSNSTSSKLGGPSWAASALRSAGINASDVS